MKRFVAYGWALAILQAVALLFAQPAFAKDKLVLAFGDSLTYGANPIPGGARHACEPSGWISG